MRRVVIRGCRLAVVSCGTVLALSVPASATTVPEETKPGAEATQADPELEAAMAVFDERMVDAGFTNLGPQPELDMGDVDIESSDPAIYEGCDPEVAKGLASFENFDAVFGTQGAPAAASDRFGPAADTTSSVTTTTDPFAMLTGGSEEVTAAVYRLDEEQIAAADEMIGIVASEGFGECLQLMLSGTMADMSDMTEISMPDFSDMSIPDFSDLSIPDFSELSIPDFSDFSIPEMPDFSIPDFSDMSIPDLSDLDGLMPEIEVIPTADLGIGDTSAGFEFTMSMMVMFPIDLSAETVMVRSGDVLVTVAHTRMNVPEESMDVDLVAEAEAILDAL
jgi:hypothetical protein